LWGCPLSQERFPLRGNLELSAKVSRSAQNLKNFGPTNNTKYQNMSTMTMTLDSFDWSPTQRKLFREKLTLSNNAAPSSGSPPFAHLDLYMAELYRAAPCSGVSKIGQYLTLHIKSALLLSP
jgi:hypothetical protein